MSVSALQRDLARFGNVSSVDARRNGPDASCASAARRPKAAKALECLLCKERYSREDVLSGLYQITTKVCSHCYGRMQAAPHAVSCFGKPDFVMPDGARLLGYSAEAHECRDLCPDRAMCASVADPASYNPGE